LSIFYLQSCNTIFDPKHATGAQQCPISTRVWSMVVLVGVRGGSSVVQNCGAFGCLSCSIHSPHFELKICNGGLSLLHSHINWGLGEGAQVFKTAALLGTFHDLFVRAIPSSKYAMGA